MSKQATQTKLISRQLMKISRILGIGVYIDAKENSDIKTSSVFYQVYTTNWENNKPTQIGIAEFYLGEMLGCPAACISFGALVYPEYRNKGVGKLLNKLRESIAKIDGYSTMLCTVDMENEHQLRILDANGWSSVGHFLNKETGHSVNLRMKNLE